MSLGTIMAYRTITQDNCPHDTKSLIIKKISEIERLEKHEVNLLINMLKDLHNELHHKDKRVD